MAARRPGRAPSTATAELLHTLWRCRYARQRHSPPREWTGCSSVGNSPTPTPPSWGGDRLTSPFFSSAQFESIPIPALDSPSSPGEPPSSLTPRAGARGGAKNKSHSREILNPILATILGLFLLHLRAGAWLSNPREISWFQSRPFTARWSHKNVIQPRWPPFSFFLSSWLGGLCEEAVVGTVL